MGRVAVLMKAERASGLRALETTVGWAKTVRGVGEKTAISVSLSRARGVFSARVSAVSKRVASAVRSVKARTETAGGVRVSTGTVRGARVAGLCVNAGS